MNPSRLRLRKIKGYVRHNIIQILKTIQHKKELNFNKKWQHQVSSTFVKYLGINRSRSNPFW